MSRARELADRIAKQFFGARVIRVDTYQPTAEQFALLSDVLGFLQERPASLAQADREESPAAGEAEVEELRAECEERAPVHEMAGHTKMARKCRLTIALIAERARDKAELAAWRKAGRAVHGNIPSEEEAYNLVASAVDERDRSRARIAAALATRKAFDDADNAGDYTAALDCIIGMGVELGYEGSDE